MTENTFHTMLGRYHRYALVNDEGSICNGRGRCLTALVHLDTEGQAWPWNPCRTGSVA
jgi:hypothetical protein